jgi:hypothetical protein
LADYFRRCEAALGTRLQQSQSEARAELLDTWIQFAPTQELDQALSSLRQVRDGDADEILSQSLELQTEIMAVFRELAGSMAVPEVCEVLLDLADQEESVAEELGLAKVMDRDA